MENRNNEKIKERNLSYAVIAMCGAVILTLAIVVAICLKGPNAMGTVEMEKPSISATAPTEKFVLPVKNSSVTRQASLDKLVYMPSLNMWKTHDGVDFSAQKGDKALAIYSGEVKSVERTTLEGVVVTIDHGNGVVSVYKSLESATVKAGDTVKGGDEIGAIGTMISEDSDGVHLHLEMKKDGKLVNPMQYLDSETDK